MNLNITSYQATNDAQNTSWSESNAFAIKLRALGLNVIGPMAQNVAMNAETVLLQFNELKAFNNFTNDLRLYYAIKVDNAGAVQVPFGTDTNELHNVSNGISLLGNATISEVHTLLNAMFGGASGNLSADIGINVVLNNVVIYALGNVSLVK